MLRRLPHPRAASPTRRHHRRSEQPGRPRELQADEVINATGFRPDHGIASELRLALDPAMESAAALAPLIDPNVHTCGTVPAHGAIQLAHPDPGYWIVGMKTYGRAPTFLLTAGHEQVRSVTALDLDGLRQPEITSWSVLDGDTLVGCGAIAQGR